MPREDLERAEVEPGEAVEVFSPSAGHVDPSASPLSVSAPSALRPTLGTCRWHSNRPADVMRYGDPVCQECAAGFDRAEEKTARELARINARINKQHSKQTRAITVKRADAMLQTPRRR